MSTRAHAPVLAAIASLTIAGCTVGPAPDDPELAMLRDRYRDDVRCAFADAFAGLTEQQRNLLRQYHIDELTIDQLGALHGINRATAARWIAAARRTLLVAMRRWLVDQLGITRHEVDSIVRLVRSQLDVSVREITP